MSVDWEPGRHSPHCTCHECLPVPRNCLDAFHERCQKLGARILLDPLVDSAASFSELCLDEPIGLEVLPQK